MVFKNHDQSEDSSGMMSKTPTSKFLGKARSGNSQYTSTNSSIGGLEYSKYTEQDVLEEFQRLSTQLEILKEKNMRMGNRHLASKIIAMQDAARSHDSTIQQESTASRSVKHNNTLSVLQEKTSNDINSEDESPIKIKRQSVSFASQPEANSDIMSSCKEKIEENASATVSQSATDSSSNIELKTQDEKKDSPSSSDRNSRYLKSGHARTHAIVINLDDKSRFTEEVTV